MIEINGLFYEVSKYCTACVDANMHVSGDIVIPEYFVFDGKTYGVMCIGSCAFYSCESLTSIILPPSLKRIRSGAFLLCTGLTSITLPESLVHIEAYAFGGCKNLKHIRCEFNKEPIVEYSAFSAGPYHRKIYTKNNYIGMVPFEASERIVNDRS